jgi:uncharacterized membrane protein
MMQLVLGFLPWIILAALGERWFVPALALAFAAAAAAVIRQISRGTPKILDAATCAFFAFMLVTGVGFHWTTPARHMSLLVNLTLTAIAWGSLVAGTPFTIQYAREQVAPEFWHAPMFVRINQYITFVWGLDFALSALVSLYREMSGDSGFAAKYAWVLFSLGAVLFTTHFPAWYRAHAHRPAPPDVPSGGG